MKASGLLFLLTASVFLIVISCKKEDDPAIVYSVLNKTLTSSRISVIDSIDLNLDTKFDFGIIANKNSIGDTAVCYLIGIDLGRCYVDSTKRLGLIYNASPLNKNETPEMLSTAKRWSNATFIAARFGADIYGFAGAGDKFIPVLLRNPQTNKNHYGWIRVNVSADYAIYKVIDAAYNLVPDIPVKMGAQ